MTRSARRGVSGATAVIRAAAIALADAGADVVTHAELLEAADELGTEYSRHTLREALNTEANHDTGSLDRRRAGILALRNAGGSPPRPPGKLAAADVHVVRAMQELNAAGSSEVTRTMLRSTCTSTACRTPTAASTPPLAGWRVTLSGP